jgi:DNA-binding MarR family transcriptional regulator
MTAMSSNSDSSTYLVNPATPEAIAALRAQPKFAEAMWVSTAGLVARYEGGHLLNWLMDDRGRLLFSYFAIYLHFTRDPNDPSSGLTPTRMKALCAENDVCSPGRATAMLSLMRFAGYLTPDLTVIDRRQRRLLVTDKLTALIADRQRLHFSAMAPLFADGEALMRALDDPAFVGPLVIAMAERFRAGFRFLSHAPNMELFGTRNAALLILSDLLSRSGPDASKTRCEVRFSISAMSRRFKVSRPHVLKLMRDAEAQGFLERVGNDGDRVVILRPLIDAAEEFFATMYLFFAASGREATQRRA